MQPQPQPPQDRMVSRLVPSRAAASPARPEPRIRPGRPEFDFVIPGADGKPLLRLFENHGFLDAEYDEARLTEAAQRFLHMTLQWTGQIGLPWKEAVVEAAEGSDQ